MQNISQGFMRLSTRNKLIAAAVVFVLFACTCGALGNLFQTGNVMVSKADIATQTADVQATQTAIHQPTATPKPTPTLAQSYTAIVKHTTGDDKVSITYDAKGKVLDISDNIGEQLNTSGAVLTFRYHAFHIFQDIFTGHEPHPNVVTIEFYGPTQNSYGQSDPNAYYATAALSSATASQIVWDNLTQDQAWDIYDVATEASFFN